jgi:tetratricopeptide (TPR) repeat protein
MPFIPILEVEAVRLALEAMRQAEPLGAAHPLARFISLRRTDTPTSSAALDALIFRSLANLIWKRLNQHRGLYGLAAALPHKDSQDARLDFQPGNTELEAWSVLYYRYVRVDLDLSLDQLEAITQQDRRTLHRRQSKGIARLTHDLVRRELRARARQRKAALRAQLPLPYAPQLIGRADLMASALVWLNAPRPPRHLILSGAPGVGKSALALALAHRLIDEDIIQRVVWVARPYNLLEQIAVELGLAPDPDGSLARQVILSTYLQRVDTLVVIDDAQELVEDARTLPAMLQTLGAARLLICASSPDMLHLLDLPCLHVPELDPVASLELLARESARSRKTRSEEHLSQIYREVGGNPRGLRLAVAAGRHYSPQPISADLYGAVWAKASPAAQLIWLILALHASPCTESDLQRMLVDETDTPEALDALGDLSVIEPGGVHGQVALLPLARAYAEIVLQDSTRETVSRRAVEIVHDDLIAHPDAAVCLHLLDVVQRALMPSALRLDLAYAFASLVERAGAWLQWCNYLELLRDETAGTDRLWIGLRLGSAYRWLAQWDDAIYLLSAVIEDAGRAGAFDMQARAMVELAVVHRLQRRPDVAAQLLNRAENYYRRHPDREGQDREGSEQVTAEYVQLALDAGETQIAQQYLDRPGKALSPRLLNLAAFVALRAGDLVRALDLAQAAQHELSGDTPRLARTLALIGQIHYHLGNWATAVNHLVYALALMEETRDVLGHARARLNLSAIYLSRGNLRAALRYLHGLPAELERLGDVVSLEAALNNLRVLNEVSSRWLSRARRA